MSDKNDYTSTLNKTYTEQLIAKQKTWWKVLLNIQAPYKWNLQRLQPGFTLDIGCGIGRNLSNLNTNGIGIDHNPHSVNIARSYGLRAFTPEEFKVSPFNKASAFDSILLSHVAEHMSYAEAIDLIKEYIYLLKPDGKLILITPQDAGYKSDPTHIEFMDFEKLEKIAQQLRFRMIKKISFPFPRLFGCYFKYNEFVTVNIKI